MREKQTNHTYMHDTFMHSYVMIFFKLSLDFEESTDTLLIFDRTS